MCCRSLAVNEVRQIADSLLTETRSADGRTIIRTQNTTSELVRAALQGLTACTGAALGGSDCGGAAAGAATSVVLNALINNATGNTSTVVRYDANGNAIPPDPNSLEDQQARTNLIATLVGAISIAAGLDASSAVTAAQIETENNAERTLDGRLIQRDLPTSTNRLDVLATFDKELQDAFDKARLNPFETDESVIARYKVYTDCLEASASSGNNCSPTDPRYEPLAELGAAFTQADRRETAFQNWLTTPAGQTNFAIYGNVTNARECVNNRLRGLSTIPHCI